MAEGKPSPRDPGAQKRGPPKTSTRVQGEQNPPAQKKPSSAKKREQQVDEMEGLFVDAVPESKKSKAARASDRRRERGQAPQPTGVPDTRTSLPAKEQESRREREREQQRDAQSQLSELNPKGFAKATLTCTRGPEEGLSLNLIEGNYTVGRARENSFVLKDIAASRRHLRIDVDARGARVIDLGSGNGTRVNGKRIGEHELKHGDKIEIGGSVLQYQEKGRSAGDNSDRGGANGSGSIDDAQERVIRAAEKLAAELSERMRFGEESQSGFEDAHVAATRALPPSAKKELAEEIARSKQGQGQAVNPQKLWKETFTNLPLDKVVPADEPLRGPRAAEAVQAPQPPQVATRQALPRPQPLPIPPPPDDEIELSGSSSRGGSFMTSVLVTALVVVVGGGAVLGALILTRHKSSDSEQVAEEATQQAFDDAMAKTDRALDAEDWPTALEYSTTALQLRPGDKSAARLQREARKHLEDLKKPVLTPAPSPAAPSGPAPTGPQATVTEVPPTPTTAPPPPAPAPVATTAPPPPAPAPVAATSTPAPKPKPRPVATTSAPSAPKPKAPVKGKSGTMSEDAAQARFEDAVNALRDKDNKKGCKILEDIADKAPSDSRWKEKAENLYSRRCD